MQANLFSEVKEPESRILLPLPNAEVYYYPALFSPKESEWYFNNLMKECNWHSAPIVLFGKQIMQPRLIAWHADQGVNLRYSGSSMDAHPFTPTLLIIKNRIERLTGMQANGVLANLYRNGADSMGWHADDERELGPSPVIPSLSFGAERLFRFRHKTDNSLGVYSLRLSSGSMLLMQGQTQQFYKHELPKTKAPIGPRINLTFRKMLGQRSN
jgi:alkylated DNA repair dioxygenase AlkB